MRPRNYVAMPPWSISNQCLSRTEQLAGLVRDEFSHGLDAGEDAQHERLRRARVAERQEQDCRTAGEEEKEEEEEEGRRRGYVLLNTPPYGHGKWDLKRSVGALIRIGRVCDMGPALKAALPFAIAPQASPPLPGWHGRPQDPSDGGRLLETAKLPSPVVFPFHCPCLSEECLECLRVCVLSDPPLSQITLEGLHSPLTLSDSPSLKGHTLQRLPLRLVLLHTNTPHTFLLELHEALPWPQEKPSPPNFKCLLDDFQLTPIPRVCQLTLRSTSRLGFCSLSSRRHESSPSLDPPSNARSLDHASLTIARSELLRRTFSPFFLPWDPHSVLPLVQQPNLLPLLLRLRSVSSIDLSLLVITKRNTVDYFAGE
ncbi:hypothetical protein CFIO01_00541 [Colletotrichum fioriniae PJ7]|uniref:Uncharacterized protein n=1 Tax=Colletotrichum fioriniae PJ7 TaxID=1445577 RepID=A0A010QPI4_9PEZI|nr:hypothetical protein CFIO01_00541 [Colletotrichum fioriniae PJ7]